jgi:hypothetical protein
MSILVQVTCVNRYLEKKKSESGRCEPALPRLSVCSLARALITNYVFVLSAHRILQEICMHSQTPGIYAYIRSISKL